MKSLTIIITVLILILAVLIFISVMAHRIAKEVFEREENIRDEQESFNIHEESEKHES